MDSYVNSVSRSFANVLQSMRKDQIDRIKKNFIAVDTEGKGSIGAEEFSNIIKSVIGSEGISELEVHELCCKLDPYSLGVISLNDFFIFHLQYGKLKKKDIVDSYRPFKEIPSLYPCLDRTDSMIAMEVLKSQNNEIDYVHGSYISCSKDGKILFWNEDLQIMHKESIDSQERRSNSRLKLLITDMVTMPNSSMIALSTSSWDVRFYDSSPSDFQHYFSIVDFPKCVTVLSYNIRPSLNNTSSLLLCGDDAGSVHVFWIDPKFASEMKISMMLKKLLSEILFSSVAKKLIKGLKLLSYPNTHSDSVLSVKYYPTIRLFISCAACTKEAMVVQDFMGNSISHYKSKKGILCFDFCESKDWIVSGGTDTNVKIWCRVLSSRPSRILHGHVSPVTHIVLDEIRLLVISLSCDKIIKLWDLSAGDCRQTIGCKIPGLGEHDITFMFYNPVRRLLYIHTSKYAVFEGMTDDAPEYKQTHPKFISAVLYNSLFNYVITGSQNSDVKVWDFFTGKQIFHFDKTHMKDTQLETFEKVVVMSTMYLDQTQRLLITGARDGTVKIWNFNNGECLRTFETLNDQTIHAIACADRLIYVGGSERTISVLYDDGRTNFQNMWEPVHEDGISSIAFHHQKKLLASASFDGEIIIWVREIGVPRNKMTDDGTPYREYTKMTPEKAKQKQMLPAKQVESTFFKDRIAIRKILFLESRPLAQAVASLVSCGMDGKVRFWSVCPGSSLLARFGATPSPRGVLVIATDADNKYLITGDTAGYIRVWFIYGYCNSYDEETDFEEEHLKQFSYLRLQKALQEKGFREPQYDPTPSDPFLIETKEPKLLNTFRAHLDFISSVEFVDGHDMILTGADDGNVRLWHMSGRFVGHFGSGQLWNLTDLKPLVPGEIRDMPQDIRRAASPTTLKVINSGACPRWEHAFRVIRKSKRKASFALSAAERKKSSSLTGPILGKYYQQKEKPMPTPKIDLFQDTSSELSAFGELRVYDFERRQALDVGEQLAKSLIRTGYVKQKKKGRTEKNVSPTNDNLASK